MLPITATTVPGNEVSNAQRSGALLQPADAQSGRDPTAKRRYYAHHV